MVSLSAMPFVFPVLAVMAHASSLLGALPRASADAVHPVPPSAFHAALDGYHDIVETRSSTDAVRTRNDNRLRRAMPSSSPERDAAARAAADSVDAFIRARMVEYPDLMSAAAGLNGTAIDLARFVAAVGSGRLLGETALREMWSPAKLNNGNTAREGPFAWGLDWLVDSDGSHPSVTMMGTISRAFRHYVNDSLTVVVLTNLHGANPYGLVDGVAQMYLR